MTQDLAPDSADDARGLTVVPDTRDPPSRCPFFSQIYFLRTPVASARMSEANPAMLGCFVRCPPISQGSYEQ